MTEDQQPAPMTDLAIIDDPKIIKILFEPTRAEIIFKYLVNNAMTVKQLADALDKNPGTILHHIDKLKKAGLVVQERTEQTVTNIVQRYYRATAREYRLGLSGMMQADNGVAQFARKRLESMISSLSIYGIDIPEEEVDDAIAILQPLIERENEVSADVPIRDPKAYRQLSESVQKDASRIMRRYVLDKDTRYQELREKWHSFLRNHEQETQRQ
ncbi:ArsR family transcriptional regulator [Candidatus Thorarchaeota archaeon]|nr:MAG: ArsR family transcriptional regulator [Candidatus Thorarchaeota archaeon]